MARSLRGRLGVALAVTAFASVALTAVLSVGLLRRSAADQARADLRRVAETIAGVRGDALIRDELRLGTVRRLLEINGDELAVILSDGRVLERMSSRLGSRIVSAIDLAPLLDGRASTGSVPTGDGEFVFVAVPVGSVAGPARPSLAGVVIARPVAVTRELWGPLVGRITLAALAAVALAVIASGLIARRLAEPVHALSVGARTVAGGDLSHRVAIAGDDELAGLGRSFNDMAASLAEAQRREREFLASVSHELRTPLTAIRGYAEAIEDGTVATKAERQRALRIIRSETDRLERMVQDVMDLARLGARDFPLAVRPVDLAETLRETVTALQARAQDEDVTLEAEIPDALHAVTDPDRVQQVASNLIENALRVTASSGSVRLRARAAGDGAVIEVADTGPGIDPQDLPHVFERSYLWRRSKGARPVGTGLGLAIVRELVGRLGGTVTVDSEAGRGTTFVVVLPAAPAGATGVTERPGSHA